MFKLIASIKKEALVLWNDKVGLLFMFLMPLLLVTVVTIVQDSAFQLANNNRIKMVVVNHDQGINGERLIELLNKSGMFGVSIHNQLDESEISAQLKTDNALSAIYIPPNFTEVLTAKKQYISRYVLTDFGLFDSIGITPTATPNVTLFFDPVLQQNFQITITNVVDALLAKVESNLLLELLYIDMETEKDPKNAMELIYENRVKINTFSATNKNAPTAANATQHNVPAWTIFAMFFMVISLGGNIVKEKVSGSFTRLQTMPTSVSILFLAKMLLYLLVAVLQVVIIFGFSVVLFPFIGLPELEIPQNWSANIAVVILSGLTAVSFAMLIGAMVKTQVQANGIGAISVIILAALGGIWVPVFMMPDHLQAISVFSPLRQSLDAFYTLFLQNGNWTDLRPTLLKLVLFISLFQITAFAKLKLDKVI